MRVKNTKIKITIPIPIDKSDCNKTVYTEKAIEKAVNAMHLANDDSEPADEIKQDVPANDVVQSPVIEEKPAETGDTNGK